MEGWTCAFARNLVYEITVKELQLQLWQMMYALLASVRIVCCIVPRLWFYNICGRLGRRRSTILEMSLSDIHLTVFLWSGLVILRVSLFHSPNSLGIYHKMYTFGSFVCSGRPDMWYLWETGLWHARLSCLEDFRKREYFQPVYFRLYNMLSFKWYICSNLQPVFASSEVIYTQFFNPFITQCSMYSVIQPLF